ncbi:MAG TPA: thiamine phosphate synthase [Candidatus Acidoferrum sp.]|nr:thiamine phosphate synthase [Candidatus Acidoferrum sp.]
MDELSLCLVTDRTQTRGRDLVAVVGECLAAGLPAVQVREKDLGAGDLALLCRRLLGPARDVGAMLIVNDRVDVALAVGADAVQRTHASLAVQDMRAVAGRRLRIGVSVHSLEDAVDAELKGADWVTYGPVYDTPSKRPYGAPQGLDRLATVARGLRIPVVAIGGITPERVKEVRAAGARGVAAISAILAAESPAEATRRFLEKLA